MQIELGDTVRDTITKFTGVVIGRSDWLNGCVRFVIQGTKLREGAIPDPQHIDEAQLELIKKGKKRVPKTEKDPGGPLPVPKRVAANAR